MPKLTVVIPVHNEEKRLPRCLQSILAQSFTDWEVICVDDGSGDGTADILQNYVNKDKRIHGSAFSRHLGTVLTRKLAHPVAEPGVLHADEGSHLHARQTAVPLHPETPESVSRAED